MVLRHIKNLLISQLRLEKQTATLNSLMPTFLKLTVKYLVQVGLFVILLHHFIVLMVTELFTLPSKTD